MKKFINRIGVRICLVCIAAVMLGGALWGYFLYRDFLLPKFQNVTLELGEPLPAVEDFLTEAGRPQKASMVTPVEEIDLTAPGEQNILFAHGRKMEAVTLTVVDTTAPEVRLQDLTSDGTVELKPEDFVVEVIDRSPVTVSFVQPVDRGEGYGYVAVQIAVIDASGNRTVGQCGVQYVWMRQAVTLELGDTLEQMDLLLNPDADPQLIDQAQLDRINAAPVGTYTVTATAGGETCRCEVTVCDTTPPTLELKSLQVYIGESVNWEDFVVSCTDLSAPVTMAAVALPDTDSDGVKTVSIEAVDAFGNKCVQETVLEVLRDTTPPNISGLSTIYTNKNVTPNYKSGVSAWDELDGGVSFSYSAANVDLSRAGTYYVTYTAKDTKGNQATARRKVVVNHDAGDTAQKVRDIAAKLSSNPEKLRDYVRNNIRYNSGSDWGGDDPVWYGFTEKKGNCYVHALCFQELLNEKGIPNQLIWVKDQTHYWNLVYINGQWRHMDATPGRQHSRYSIMNDAQRLETLSGRDWDRDQWPVCE